MGKAEGKWHEHPSWRVHAGRVWEPCAAAKRAVGRVCENPHRTRAASHRLHESPRGYLTRGLSAIVGEAERKAEAAAGQEQDFYRAVAVSLRGLLEYARNLAASLELALYQGTRPATGDEVFNTLTAGPRTFCSYDELWRALQCCLSRLACERHICSCRATSRANGLLHGLSEDGAARAGRCPPGMLVLYPTVSGPARRACSSLYNL